MTEYTVAEAERLDAALRAHDAEASAVHLKELDSALANIIAIVSSVQPLS
jgi:hypothetical protein